MNKNVNFNRTTQSNLFTTIEKKHFFPYLTEKCKQINDVLNIASKTIIYIYPYMIYIYIYNIYIYQYIKYIYLNVCVLDKYYIF